MSCFSPLLLGHVDRTLSDIPFILWLYGALTILESDRAMHFVRLAAVYAMMGKKEESKQAALEARKRDPKAPVDRFID